MGPLKAIHGRNSRQTTASRAFTLIETVVALWVLIVSAMASAQMYRSALRSYGLARDESLAILLCERKVEEIRWWSRQYRANGQAQFSGPWQDGVNDDDLCDGNAPVVPAAADAAAAPFVEAPDPENPQYFLKAQAWRYAYYTPARTLNGSLALTRSARILLVSATSERATSGPRGKTVSIVAPVLEPPRTITTANVSPASGTLAPGATVTLNASPADAAGPIPDSIVLWYVAAADGNGTVQNSPPTSSKLSNYVLFSDKRRHVVPGVCTVQARMMSDGREFWDWSGRFTMSGPAGLVP